MLCPLFLCQSRRTLEAEVGGRQGGDDLAVRGFRCLGYDGVVVEYAPQYHLVMLYRGVDDILALGEQPLHMFCNGRHC